ncbi:tRNA3(Ser)-specific nuclease WapA precursor [Enhygromyxa salina]|uniref:tRNA3(Ser)-specific nuclease WapA n=2 Tax=Enhygromyxa salina TaxID=215803 RepID=A0A2S9YAP2_9BACT|nr:tRNA3(Ser)-specific nuclease WapA precursor [Enhygromyxa salina]
MRSWDDRDQRFSYVYDALRRLVDRSVSVGGGPEKLLGRVVYGDLLAAPAATNHVGRVYRVYDGAGVATTVEFDFKGEPLEEQRQLVADETTEPDWSALLGHSTIAAMASAATSLLSSETFSASSERDALSRVLRAISPDSSEVAYTYDEGGGLQKVEVQHRGSATAEAVVGDITYNARGQREAVVYGPTSSPTTTTSYDYDPQTYRLAELSTVRNSDSKTLQGLHYHYDPVGNVTDIRDDAQQTVYFQNSVVEAANSYTYDATYRLIEATGREHSTQGTTQRTDVQISVGPQPMTSDPSAMRRYTQKYIYDEVGNILKMQHLPGAGTGWTRRYVYAENGNRLDKTSAPGDPANGPYTHSYTYDAHGNMTAMPHLSSMVWNHGDELQEVTVGTETVYFQYAGGMRSRKYVEKSGTTTEERIYLGPFEIYRKRVNDTLALERETLHISDGSGRICIIETKTVDGEAVGSPTGIWRYQLSNHLGSAATEVDGSGAVISYEEYHPYGTSAYRAVDASIDVSAKRYRYTGMERDEETGLAYHSARYYAPWLGRWTAADSIGTSGGINLYEYTSSSPITSSDVTGLSPNPDGSDYTSTGGRVPYADPALTPGEYKFEPMDVEGEAYGAAPTVASSDGGNRGPTYLHDPDFAPLDLGVQGARPEQLIVGQLATQEKWNQKWSETNLVRRMNQQRRMSMGFMVGYLVTGLALATGIEGAAIALPALRAGVSSGVAATEVMTQVGSSVEAWASGDTFAVGIMALTESFAGASAAAEGLPIGGLAAQRRALRVPADSRRFMLPAQQTRARFRNLFPGDTQPPGRVVRLGREPNGRWYEYRGTSRRRAQGSYDFVVRAGDVLAVRQSKQMMTARPGHLTLSGGGDVEYAGRVQFGGAWGGRGHVRSWSNESGHYRPLPFYSEIAPFPQHMFAPGRFPGAPPPPQHPL